MDHGLRVRRLAVVEVLKHELDQLYDNLKVQADNVQEGTNKNDHVVLRGIIHDISIELYPLIFRLKETKIYEDFEK